MRTDAQAVFRQIDLRIQSAGGKAEMAKGKVMVLFGTGSGKTTAAIGKGITAIAEEKSVVMIQFLKGKGGPDIMNVLKRLEPEMKVFSFEKSNGRFEDLPEGQKDEELLNIRNALNFARKVITTDGCGLLILDEILGLTDRKIISAEELKALILQKPEEMDMILTGKMFPDELKSCADVISRIENIEP